MQESQLHTEGAALKSQLNEGFFSALRLLPVFFQNFNAPYEIQVKSVMLVSRFYDVIEEEGRLNFPEEKKNRIIAEAVGLIDDFLDNKDANDDARLESKALRERYLKKKQNDIVFQGINLCKEYQEFALKNVSVTLRLGEITSIVGENGNGKSTLLKIIAGVLSQSKGTVAYPFFFDGKINWAEIKRSIAYVPQQIPQWRNVNTIRQQLHFTAATKGIRGQANIDAVEYVLTRLNIRKYADFTWTELSGGYRLRCELARQLVWAPKLLILDEPLANLDVLAKDYFLEDLRNLADSLTYPMAIVMSSQDLYDLEKVSDNIMFIKEGLAEFNGLVDEISIQNELMCYLVEAECSLQMVEHALTECSPHILDIRKSFSDVLIFTTAEIKSRDILENLLRSGIPIKHFRDISNSTRIFFENVHALKKNIA